MPHLRATKNLERVRILVKAFIHDPSLPVTTIDEFQRVAPLDATDQKLELTPKVYLTQPEPTEGEIRSGLQESIWKAFVNLVKIYRANMLVQDTGDGRTGQPSVGPPTWRRFLAEDIFNLQRGHFHSIADQDPGDYVTISRISDDNGFVDFFDIPEGAAVWPAGTITVSTVTGDAFAQPVPFIAHRQRCDAYSQSTVRWVYTIVSNVRSADVQPSQMAILLRASVLSRKVFQD